MGNVTLDLSKVQYLATFSTVNDLAWYMNSRASNHVTNDEGHLENSNVSNEKNLIVGNGDKIKVNRINKNCFILF